MQLLKIHNKKIQYFSKFELTKKLTFYGQFSFECKGGNYLLSRKALPSALMYFTSEFEMGSGGTTSE